MFNHIARRNLIKKIEQSSNETYSVTVKDVLALRHIMQKVVCFVKFF